MSVSSRADLESKTVPELKQICKDCDVKGYSKLAKDALIIAILEKKGQGTNLEQSLARSTRKVAPDPATEQLLQRTNTKVVYSRDESEARIEKNKDLVAKRAEVSGVAAAKATDSEAGAQLVRTTTTKGPSKQQVASGKSPASSPATSTPANLALTLSNARDGQVKPAPGEEATVPAKKGKLVVQTSQIQKAGSPPVKPQHKDEPASTVKPAPSVSEPASQPPAKKQAKASTSAGKIQKATSAGSGSTTPAASTVPAKLVVSPGKIQKVTPVAPSTTAPPEPTETRFQDLPADDRERALKTVSKNVVKLLKMRKPDFLKKKAKDLEKYLELLEVEKGRFTVYRPTDKALRGFMDESIVLINQVKEEQLNQLEQEYITRELPTIIKKNEKNIKKTIARIDRYYTDMDAARDLVEKYIKKAPFPSSYLITVILQKIRDKAL